jgi:hypothetical protein
MLDRSERLGLVLFSNVVACDSWFDMHLPVVKAERNGPLMRVLVDTVRMMRFLALLYYCATSWAPCVAACLLALGLTFPLDPAHLKALDGDYGQE